jgi:hypothetical protein
MGKPAIVTPSKGRHDNVLAVNAFGEDLVIMVPSNELDAYRESYPDNEVIAEPEWVRNIGGARAAIYEKFGSVFMVDDDSTGMVAVAETPPRKVSPKTACEVIYRVADMADQLGLKLWGTSRDANPLHYSPQRPFKVTGELSGAVLGLHPSEHLRIPKWPIAEDIYVCALNAYYHRAMLADMRYALPHTMNAKGGVANVRTVRTGRAAKGWLREAFGDAIHDPNIPGDLYPYSLRVPW